MPLPYQINTDGDLVVFTTSAGFVYQIVIDDVTESFQDYPALAANGVRYFSFFPQVVPTGEQTYDDRIQPTVVNSITQLLNDNRIVVFTCDSTDARERCRFRLFSRWFRSGELMTIFEKHDSVVTNEDGPEILTSLILKTSAPDKEEILLAFAELNGQFNDAKS